MSDASFNASSKHTTKPRLSLLFAKQSGIRLKSEDQPDQQITILSSPATNAAPPPPPSSDDYVNIGDANSMESREEPLAASQQQQQQQQQIQNALGPNSSGLDKESQHRINGNDAQGNDEGRMNISKEDLFRLLSVLKSELQSKEIALAAIKCEQLKRLINPVEISRSSLANTYIQLQDRITAKDRNNHNETKSIKLQTSSASNEDQNEKIPGTPAKQTENEHNNDDESDQESLHILNTLLELLDRHPLLALPRDSIYCLDYNCNELSTKNYLNLKIQHLDNLINQHRRFRYYMNERLKRSEQRYLDATRQLELERRSKFENEKSIYRDSGRALFIKHIDQLEDSIEKEKQNKQAIVMALLNELLDEREKNQALAEKLAERETKSADSLEKDSGEKERLLTIETELNGLSMQLKKQSMVFSKERNELQSKISDLEAENARLKSKLKHVENRQPVGSARSMDAKKVNQAGFTSSSGRPSIGPRQTNPPNKHSPKLVTKPQVPAKPAQLLDQQRNSLN